MTLQTRDWHFDNGGEYERHAGEFGTPYYLYDADMLAEQARRVRAAFNDTVSVYFAVKANPNLKLLESIRDDINGLDISSVGELEQALLAGYDPAIMSFAGPAKTATELERAIEVGVGSISLESERELREAIVIARRTGTRAQITVRVNPTTDPRAFGLKMGGRPLQFGVDQESLEPVLHIIAKHGNEIDFRGVHVYAGSQGFEFADMAASYRDTLAIAEHVETTFGFPVRKINFGGGFGVSHVSDDKALDLQALASAIGPELGEFHRARAGSTEFIFELGRYLVANAGIYVTRVIGIKQSRGKLFVITDGGVHHHLAAAGNFGAGFRSNYPIVNLSRPDGPETECSIAGPSCNPTDLLGQNTQVAEPREGDLLAVMSSGSYGLTASPILFLGRPTPAELVRRNGVTTLGRKRREIVDFN